MDSSSELLVKKVPLDGLQTHFPSVDPALISLAGLRALREMKEDETSSEFIERVRKIIDGYSKLV